MVLTQHSLQFDTLGRGLLNITNAITQLVGNSSITTGLCHIFLHHTSASLTLCENADPLVQRDLEAFMARLIPDGDSLYHHTDEGPDDMPAHVRTVLTPNFLVVPITDHHLGLGRWQSIYLWEHRLRQHQRSVTVTLQGI